MKKGFTLIELLVVVGIIATLVGVFAVATGGTTESARAAKCLANMRNLALAAQSCASAETYYPLAGSVQYLSVVAKTGQSGSKKMYNEKRGWISWASKDLFPSESSQSPETISCYTDDEDLGLVALTNGALWKYISGGTSVYVCPSHAKAMKKKKIEHVRWSYVMNAFFGWNADESYSYGTREIGALYSKIYSIKGRDLSADRVLLFGEIPYQGAGGDFPTEKGSSTEVDGVLQYKDCKSTSPYIKGKSKQDGDEYMGANHKYGKDWYAHAVFADGHVEKFRATADNGTKLGTEELKDLTSWLCQGKAVTFESGKYEELE